MRSTILFAVAVVGMTVAAAETPTSAQSAAVVETVVSAAQKPDGKSFNLDLILKDGQRLTIEVPPNEAVKIVDGLSKVGGAGTEKRQIVGLVQDMSIQADLQGRAVILIPRGATGPFEPLAIPIGGVDRFIQLLQQKAEEARSNAPGRH